jgi:hypothetical protein
VDKGKKMGEAKVDNKILIVNIVNLTRWIFSLFFVGTLTFILM